MRSCPKYGMMNFGLWLESTYDELYQSAVDAFPNTRMRQHATGPIKVSGVMWTPFVGLKTILVRAMATNEDRQYNPIVLFKNVAYENDPTAETVTLKVSKNESRHLKPLKTDENQILVRCNCEDFKWRFRHFNHEDRSLYGRDGAPYESKGGPPANPMEMAGCCKHLMKMIEVLKKTGLILW